MQIRIIIKHTMLNTLQINHQYLQERILHNQDLYLVKKSVTGYRVKLASSESGSYPLKMSGSSRPLVRNQWICKMLARRQRIK